MKIQIFFDFFLYSIDDTICPSVAINIHTRSLILCYSACAEGYNSLPTPVHVRHFLQFQRARPPPPLGITNSAGWQLCIRYNFPLSVQPAWIWIPSKYLFRDILALHQS